MSLCIDMYLFHTYIKTLPFVTDDLTLRCRILFAHNLTWCEEYHNNHNNKYNNNNNKQQRLYWVCWVYLVVAITSTRSFEGTFYQFRGVFAPLRVVRLFLQQRVELEVRWKAICLSSGITQVTLLVPSGYFFNSTTTRTRTTTTITGEGWVHIL